MFELFAIGLGGALGAISRYLSSRACYYIFGSQFPYGTLFVNVLGSFIIGLLMIILLEKFNLGTAWRGFLIVGFLGAFTTFSSFSYETFTLFENGLLWSAALNIILNIVLCLAMVFVGVKVGYVALGLKGI